VVAPSTQEVQQFLLGIACADHRSRGIPVDEAEARAWEDLQVAFSGHGEPFLTGGIMQLWVHVDVAEGDRFAAAIQEAFAIAEGATGTDVPRRYIWVWRNKPVRRLQEGFTLPTILPVEGPSLDQWAVDQGEDPHEVAEQFLWLERADRVEREAERRQAASHKPHLRLLPAPDEGAS